MSSLRKLTTEILVIGSGAAGMAAAASASALGVSVLIIDDRSVPGYGEMGSEP